jgi:membrane protein implicated in regulation of membrane protease activity
MNITLVSTLINKLAVLFQAAPAYWACATLALVLAELLTGALYLLALAGGAAVGWLAALLGLTLPLQMLCAGIGAVLFVWFAHRNHLARTEAHLDPAVHTDIGNQIHLDTTTPVQVFQVQYKGASWDARIQGSQTAPGWFTIVAIDRNTLVLARCTQLTPANET